MLKNAVFGKTEDKIDNQPKVVGDKVGYPGPNNVFFPSKTIKLKRPGSSAQHLCHF